MFRFAAPVMTVFLRRIGLLGLACSALTLAACGGGSRAKDYQPDRIVVFGDENSAFTTSTVANGNYTVQGLVYTVNPVTVPSGDVVFCADQNAGTRCLASDTNSLGTVTGTFTANDPSVYPQGTGYRLGDEAVANELTWIALGTATVNSNANTAVKRNLSVIYDCTASPTMMQTLAHAFGKGFNSDCSRDAGGATTYGVKDATVATVQAQINAAASAGQLGKGALAVIWVGQKDIIDIYESGAYVGLGAKRDEAKRRAQQLADVAIGLKNTGAKVIVVGVLDLGQSPYGHAAYVAGVTSACKNSVASPCNGDLQQMVDDFNTTVLIGDSDLNLKGLQDYVYKGREITFIKSGDISENFARNTSYVNAALCDVAATSTATGNPYLKPDGSIDTSHSVQYCSSLSLVSGGSTSTYLWADDRHPSWVMHNNLGLTAYNFATNYF